MTLTDKANKRLINELKKYKDIEEELGISLLILFEVLKNGCYVKHIIIYEEENNKREEEVFGFCEMPCIFYSYNKGFGFVYGHTIPFLLKDYGKTWALTKEELL